MSGIVFAYPIRQSVVRAGQELGAPCRGLTRVSLKRTEGVVLVAGITTNGSAIYTRQCDAQRQESSREMHGASPSCKDETEVE